MTHVVYYILFYRSQVDEHSKTIADITQQLNSAKAEAVKLKSSASIAE